MNSYKEGQECVNRLRMNLYGNLQKVGMCSWINQQSQTFCGHGCPQRAMTAMDGGNAENAGAVFCQGCIYGVSGVWLVQLRRPESSVPSDSTLLLQAEIPHPLVF